jgi:type III restriction enzyme
MNNSPFNIYRPEERWKPNYGSDTFQFLPPLVSIIRDKVYKWREDNYKGASNTSKALLEFWFNTEHKVNNKNYQYYFAQREAIESIIYLYEIANAQNKFELLKFDSTGRIATGMFKENWTRYVIKMATGSGKTKVMALNLVWAYFHKLYEENSTLSKNFLIITPNIIVLNRIKSDFEGLKMFFQEPFIPENGLFDKNWKDDFQLTFHLQDEIKQITEMGNIFLTNSHRIGFDNEIENSVETMFLGAKPKSDADTSKNLDLGKILRSDKIKDLIVINDEAHHIHDENLAWFKNIQDISNKLLLKTEKPISLQIDYTATPKHNDGSIFVQTISDYPLVEAIKHNIVKSPVLPDEESRAKLKENETTDFVEKYKDYIDLGYLEWKQQYDTLIKDNKSSILFVMTMNTKEADKVAEYLENQYEIMRDSVLVIHTNQSGDIKETGAQKKDKEELEKLRKAADEVDSDYSKYKAVVSVLMLREGWNVKNVTTIVGLRPFGAQSKILPEQAIGRGLRKMYEFDINEKLVVIGTNAFIEFVEELTIEGVELDYKPMGADSGAKSPIILKVDNDNNDKNLDKLDIKIPQLSSRIIREYKNLELVDVSKFNNQTLILKNYTDIELREIVFKDLDDNISHKTLFTENIPDYRNILAFFTKSILKQNRLVSGFDILYPKVEDFLTNYIFDKIVDITSPHVLKNISEPTAKNILFTSFNKAIADLTINDKGSAEIINYISLKDTKTKVVNNQPFIIPKKSVFNIIVGDNPFELEFASNIDKFTDIISFAKNEFGNGGINFNIEYFAENNTIKPYYLDFFVKVNDKEHFVVELKGREDLNDIKKIKRLINWCEDVNKLQSEITYNAIYVKQEKWEDLKQSITNFKQIIEIFSVNKNSEI